MFFPRAISAVSVACFILIGCGPQSPARPSMDGRWVRTSTSDCSVGSPGMLIDGDRITQAGDARFLPQELENVRYAWVDHEGSTVVSIIFDQQIGEGEQLRGLAMLMVNEDLFTPIAGSEDGENFTAIQSDEQKLAMTLSRCP